MGFNLLLFLDSQMERSSAYLKMVRRKASSLMAQFSASKNQASKQSNSPTGKKIFCSLTAHALESLPMAGSGQPSLTEEPKLK